MMFYIFYIKCNLTNSRAMIMSSLEKRAWLSLCSMCPPYLVYFAIQIAFPAQWPTMLDRIAVLAAAACIHAACYVTGLLLIKRREAGEALLEDERDRAIDGRATRIAYFILLAGMLVAGVVMPFNRQSLEEDWHIANTALLAIVLAEAARDALIVLGYRRPRLAH